MAFFYTNSWYLCMMLSTQYNYRFLIILVFVAFLSGSIFSPSLNFFTYCVWTVSVKGIGVDHLSFNTPPHYYYLHLQRHPFPGSLHTILWYDTKDMGFKSQQKLSIWATLFTVFNLSNILKSKNLVTKRWGWVGWCLGI